MITVAAAQHIRADRRQAGARAEGIVEANQKPVPIRASDLFPGHPYGARLRWCEIQNGILELIPHPDSGVPTPNLPLSGEVDVMGRVTGVALRITGEEFVPIVSRRISLNCCRTKSMKSVDGSVDQNPFGDGSARHGDAEFGADASRRLFLRMSEGSRDYAGLILDACQSRQERKVPAQTLQL